ncbi:MAG: NosD domain-containing protein [Candidatus Micrarchaeia archaeon]
MRLQHLLFILMLGSLPNAALCGKILTNTTLDSSASSSDICFTIMENYTVLDCGGYTIRGTGSGHGILVENLSNITIRNCIISDFVYGIYITNCENITLSNITVSDTRAGVVINRTVFFNMAMLSINTSRYGVVVENCTNGNAFFTVATRNTNGILLQNSTNITIAAGKLHGNKLYSLILHSSFANNITNNTLDNIAFMGNLSYNTTGKILTNDADFNAGNLKNVFSNSGTLMLYNTSSNGSWVSAPIYTNMSPFPVSSTPWKMLSWDADVPDGTALSISILDAYTNETLLANLTSPPYSLSSLRASAIKLLANFTTFGAFTPLIHEINITYDEEEWFGELLLYNNSIDETNTVNGGSFYFFSWRNIRNASDCALVKSTTPRNTSFVMVVGCKNFSIDGGEVKNGLGILFLYSKNASVRNAILSSNQYGVNATYSSFVSLKNITFLGNEYGIYASNTTNITAENITFKGNKKDIKLANSSRLLLGECHTGLITEIESSVFLMSGLCVEPCECGVIKEGMCVKYQCCEDSDCGEGMECKNHFCVAKIEPQCRSNEECKDNEYCNTSSGVCVTIFGSCGYAKNHTWFVYPCCEDSDCGNGFCINHTCIKKNTTVTKRTDLSKYVIKKKEEEIPIITYVGIAIIILVLIAKFVIGRKKER